MAALNPSPTIQSYDWEGFKEIYGTLLKQHEGVVQTGMMNENAFEAAARLARVVEDLRQRLTWTASTAELNHFLIEGEPLLPIALKISEMIANEMVQCSEEYIAELSRPVRDLMNISVFQCDARELRIYDSSVEKVRKYLRDVIKTRSYDQCETEFSLKCAHSATKKLEIGKGKWREVRNRHRGELAEGIVGVILTANPLPPFISLAPIAPPLMHLCADIYNEKEDKWYGTVSIMMFEQERGILRNLNEFCALKTHFINQNHTDYKIYFYLTTVFREMLSECIHSGEEHIKFEIIYAEDISLKTILNERLGILSSLSKNQSKFGRVRYNALKVIGSVQDCRGISQLILECIGKPHEIKKVKDLAKSLLKERPLPQEPERQQLLQAVGRLLERLKQEGGVILGQVNDDKGEIIEINKELAPLLEVRDAQGDTFENGLGDGIDPEELDSRITNLQKKRNEKQAVLAPKESELEELRDTQDYLSSLARALETGMRKE